MKKIFLLVIISQLFFYESISANELKFETSPYLQAHKNDPLNWYPWEKGIKKALKENRPIFLSIGYSTCHWCHVMQRESFKNKSLAKLLNKNFVSIKVDREEMPQIDALYQELYLKVKGRRGGWPLTLFLTPSREVFYIGSYIPLHKESYAEGLDTLVPRLAKAFYTNSLPTLQEKPRELFENATEDALNAKSLAEDLKESYDEIYSGFGVSKKFPEASKLSLMMDLAALNHDKELESFAYEMLDMMALRGLYDQVEGGFFRYSTDAAWEIPHFEKMLYTQAELIPLYVRAYQKTKKELYKNVVEETIAMLEKHYKKNNLYYSASNADTNEKEGAYFTFTKEEIAQTEFEFYPNFKDQMHINIEDEKRPSYFKVAREKLLKVREKKEYPFIDKKINTAWNALMIEALYSASVIDKRYANMADETLQKLTSLMFERGVLYHQTLLDRVPTQKGLLEDYSFFIAALLAGYEVDYDAKKLDFVAYLLEKAKEKFYKKGIWYLSDDGLKIQAGLLDKYYVSPLSKMMQNIIIFASLKGKLSYEKLFLESMKVLQSRFAEKKSEVPALARAYLMQKLQIMIIKSSSKNLMKNRELIESVNYPFVLRKKELYQDYLVCSLRRCYMKTSNLKKILLTLP